jgi:hypothetical protein
MTIRKFSHEDGGSIFPRNVGMRLKHTAFETQNSNTVFTAMITSNLNTQPEVLYSST